MSRDSVGPGRQDGDRPVIRGRILIQSGYNGEPPPPLGVEPGEIIEKSLNGPPPSIPRSVIHPTSPPPPKSKGKKNGK